MAGQEVEDGKASGVGNKYSTLSRRTFRSTKLGGGEELAGVGEHVVLNGASRASLAPNEEVGVAEQGFFFHSVETNPTSDHEKLLLNENSVNLEMEDGQRLDLLKMVNELREQLGGLCQIHCSRRQCRDERTQWPEAPTKRRHCRAISGGAPFAICSNCLRVLHLPLELSVCRRRRYFKVKCGGCRRVVAVSLQASVTATGQPPAPALAGDPISFSEEYDEFCAEKSCSSEEAERLVRHVPRENGEERKTPAPLHELMGYCSATLDLLQPSYN